MIKFAAIFALAQAALTALLALAGFEESGIRLGPRNLIDVLLLGGAGIAILRGHRWATYILAALGIVDLVQKFYWFGHPPWIIPALVYCGAAIAFTKDALQRRCYQQVPPTRKAIQYRANWPVWLAATGAFLQAGVILLVLLQAAEEGRLRIGIEGITSYSLLDVIILSAFAIAVLKRHLWAAYALVGYGLFGYGLDVVRTGEFWSPYFVIYLVAAWFLRKKPYVAPQTIQMLQWRSMIKYATVWWAGFEIVAFIFGLLGLTQGGVHRTTETLVVHILVLVVWGVALFGFLAWREPAWPFESALITSVAAFCLSILDGLVIPVKASALLFRFLGIVAIAMLGVACACVLPKRTVSTSEAEKQ